LGWNVNDGDHFLEWKIPHQVGPSRNIASNQWVMLNDISCASNSHVKYIAGFHHYPFHLTPLFGATAARHLLAMK
jgi:hypothetical protein